MLIANVNQTPNIIMIRILNLTLFITLLMVSATFAQRKPNDKYYSISFKEKQYPLKPLPKEIKTYASKIGGYTRLDKVRLRTKYLRMPTLEIDNENPHITIRVKLPGYGFRAKTQIKQKEYKNDKTKVKYYRYYVLQEYNYTVEYMVYKTKNDELLAEGTFVDSGSKNFEERKSRKEAYQVYTNAVKGGHNRRLEENAIKVTLTKVKKAFESDFLLVDKSKSLGLGDVKGDGDRLPDIKKAYKLAKEGIEAYSSGGKKGAEAKLNEAIEIWKKALTESDLKKRKSRINYRMTRMINYNLAFAYYLLDDFSNAKKYAEDCKKLKGIRYRAGSIIRMSNQKEKRYKANSIAFK